MEPSEAANLDQVEFLENTSEPEDDDQQAPPALEIDPDFQNPQIGEQPEPSVFEVDFDVDPPTEPDPITVRGPEMPSIPESAPPARSRLPEQQLTVQTSLQLEQDNRPVEQAFGAAYCSMAAWSVSSELDLSALPAYSDVAREGILLLFTQCQDLLEGREIEEPTAEISISENREVHHEALDAQLEQLEKTIEKANAPRTLREIAERRGSARLPREAPPAARAPSAVRRMVVGILDAMAVAVCAAALASVFEAGGLPAVLAEISIDGITSRHLPIVLSAVTLMPIVGILYLFVSYVAFGNSPAARLLSISLRTDNGRPLKLRHIAVRSASAPLALAIGGYLPVLFGGASLTDRLARTKVLIEVDEQQDDRPD